MWRQPPASPTVTDPSATELQRRQFTDRLFDEAAPHYDRINRLIAFGVGSWYRRWALSRAGLRPGMTVLDIGIGTGAVARAAARLVGPSGRVVGLDPSIGMLTQAAQKLRMPVIQGVAEGLPFRDATFDFLSMGYALRYVADLRATFAECHRVLRPGGTLLILDLARPRARAGYYVARFYLDTAIPWMARLGSGSKETQLLVNYCWTTIDRAIPSETIHASLAACGFDHLRRTLWVGLLSEQVAVKSGGLPAGG